MTGHDDQARQDDLWEFLQPPADEARRLRDRGVETALNGADSRARGAAERALADLAASGVVFTSDDLHERIGHPLACKPSVMGSLFLSAARAGKIEHVGHTRSTRPSSHGREIKTWRGTAKAHQAPPEPKATLTADLPQASSAPPKPAPSSSSGVWTVADVAQPCSTCSAPAFMRLDGKPRHKSYCAEGA